MAAYIVANYRVTNPESFKAYAPAVLPTLLAHGAEVLVADVESEAIEGITSSYDGSGEVSIQGGGTSVVQFD